LPVPPTGAQRASRQTSSFRRSRSLLGSLLAASLLASLIAVPAAASTGSTVRIPSATAPATTTIDRPWLTEETYYKGLANCTRTCGWVLTDGTCRGYGSGRYSTYVAPFMNGTYIADKVARPYARYLAKTNQCSHYLDGDPGYRLRRAGFTTYAWGENIGCRSGYSTVKAAILASHLVFQSEKAANGGHWKNLKNPKLKWIGIGVWYYAGRVRLVTDFWQG
jgi:hypothetical protein